MDTLICPGRPPTPSDGRAQHYMRPGKLSEQSTRAFGNGTTLTFGSEDVVASDSPENNAFWDQKMEILRCVENIVAVRQLYLAGEFDQMRDWDVPTFAIKTTPLNFNAGNLSSATLTNRELTRKALAGKLSTAHIYQGYDRSNIPGEGHNGFTTDIRGSEMFKFNPNAIPQHMQGMVREGEHNNFNGSGGRAARGGRDGSSSGGRNHFTRHRLSGSEVLQHDTLYNMPPKDDKALQLRRAKRIMAELIVVPGENGMLRIRLNPSSPTNIPEIQDVIGPAAPRYWGDRFSRNANPASGGCPNELIALYKENGVDGPRIFEIVYEDMMRPVLDHFSHLADVANLLNNEIFRPVMNQRANSGYRAKGVRGLLPAFGDEILPTPKIHGRRDSETTSIFYQENWESPAQGLSNTSSKTASGSLNEDNTIGRGQSGYSTNLYGTEYLGYSMTGDQFWRNGTTETTSVSTSYDQNNTRDAFPGSYLRKSTFQTSESSQSSPGQVHVGRFMRAPFRPSSAGSRYH